MDIMTLAAAKSYTDKKTANGGAADLSNYYTKQEIDDKKFITQDQLPDEEYVVDDSLTMEGVAADAKATGDRLTNIEYQTVTTDLAYEHKDLPIGEKTVTVSGDGTFGGNAYIYAGEDYTPQTGFAKPMPFSGVTIVKNGSNYHISGTSEATTAYLSFAASSNSTYFSVPSELIGKTIKLLTFSDAITGYNFGAAIRFYDASYVEVAKASTYIGKASYTYESSVVVPETAVFYIVNLTISSNKVYDQNFSIRIVDNAQLQKHTFTDNTVEVSGVTLCDFETIPYMSTASMSLSLRDYIAYKSATISYLTPEEFGAFGDGVTDDSVPIANCLFAASERNKIVIMANRYYVTSPIEFKRSGVKAIINEVVYSGSDCAVKIYNQNNSIDIHSIQSSGIGIVFSGDGTMSTSYNNVKVNTIKSDSHGIAFIEGAFFMHQNTVKFDLIRAGGDGCHGICYLKSEEGKFIAEGNFYGGQIANCDYAIYDVGGLSRCYGIEIEDNVKAGVYTATEGGLILHYARVAEPSRDGELPFFKFIGTNNVDIYLPSPLSIAEIDLTDAIDIYENASGDEYPCHECRMGAIYGTITAPPKTEGGNVDISSVYARETFLWGKYLIMQPHMAYRKAVTESTFDTRNIGYPLENQSPFTQLPTKFVVDNVNTEIYLHESYCAFGFNEFEVEQANGFTCKIYDKLNNLIFDGTNQGDGLYKFNVYKDSTYCASHTSGLLRRDFTGHYWSVTKINNQAFTLEENENGNFSLVLGGGE